MTSATLNLDIVRLIIRQAACDAETTATNSAVDAFYQRSALLRRLALVHSRWTPLAQLELESFVVLTGRNFTAVSRALEQSKFGNRVKKLVDRRGVTREPQSLDAILEKCDGLAELDCQNSRLSLGSLRMMRDLRNLSFSNVSLGNESQPTVLPFRLRSFSLSGACRLSNAQWTALRETGNSTIENLELVGRLGGDSARLLDTLASWLPTIRYLDISSVELPTPVVPSLHQCRSLERLALKLSDLPAALAVLESSPQHLEVVASSDVIDQWTLEDYQTNVLYAIGKEPLEDIESVKVLRAPGVHDAPRSREVALFVKIGKRKVKAKRC
ncbi:uncharacterized protein JCM15063_003136 [Sporobolomyces koalae]|uniref:uncharacterized protein n=1 Tax=Sporobolomyces koalae TaxID=500713 RepID=UPI00316D8153